MQAKFVRAYATIISPFRRLYYDTGLDPTIVFVTAFLVQIQSGPKSKPLSSYQKNC